MLLHRTKAPLQEPVKFHSVSEIHPQNFSGRHIKGVHSGHFTLHSKPNYFNSSSIIDKLIYSRNKRFPVLYSSSVWAVLQAFLNPSPLIQPSFHSLTLFFFPVSSQFYLIFFSSACLEKNLFKALFYLMLSAQWLTRNFSLYYLHSYTQVSPSFATLGGQSALLILCCDAAKGEM